MFVLEVENPRIKFKKYVRLPFDVETKIEFPMSYSDIDELNVRILKEKTCYFDLKENDLSTMMNLSLLSSVVCNNINNCLNKLQYHTECLNVLYEYDDDNYVLMYDLECSFGTGQSNGRYYRSVLKTVKLVSKKLPWLPMVKTDTVGVIRDIDKSFIPKHVLRHTNFKKGYDFDNLFVCNFKHEKIYLINVKCVDDSDKLQYYIVAKLHDISYPKCSNSCISKMNQSEVNSIEEYLTNEAKKNKVHVTFNENLSLLCLDSDTLMALPCSNSCCIINASVLFD